MDALSWARRLLFPSPSASYDYDSYPSETVWIPRHPGAEEVAVEAARRWQQQQQREEQQQHSAHATTAAAADLAQQPAPPSPPPLPPKNAALPVFPSSSASSPSPTSLRPSTPSGSSPSTPPFTSASASASASVASSSSSSSPAAGVCGELPAFFLPSRGADLLVVHAHGNGIDIGGMHSLCRFYQTHIRAHFLLFEYPGYGICDGEASEVELNAHLWSVLVWVEAELRWPLSRVLLFGQSIGSGPCCWAAAWLNRAGRHLAGLVLQSPFTSIREVARDLVGSAAASLVAERWQSVVQVEFIVDPVLLLHGVKDELIACAHSERLYARCASPHRHLLLLPDATHNEFNLVTDVLQPITQFIQLYTHIKQRHRHTAHTPQVQHTPLHSPHAPPSSTASAAATSAVVWRSEPTLQPSSQQQPATPSSSSPSRRSTQSMPSSSSISSLSTSACPPSDSDVAIRALLTRSKTVSPRTADGSVCEAEFLVGNLGELIPLDVSVPRRFTTVPASAIASHVRRVEARKREEEARQRAKERKEFVAGLWERGKASLLGWSKPSTPATPHPPPQSSARSSPRSSTSAAAGALGDVACASSSPFTVALPTAVPIPPLPPRPPPPPRLCASSQLSICVATAAQLALDVVELVDPSYSSPRARLFDPASPSPSPSASSRHLSRMSQSQSHSLLTSAISTNQQSPSLSADEEKDVDVEEPTQLVRRHEEGAGGGGAAGGDTEGVSGQLEPSCSTSQLS